MIKLIASDLDGTLLHGHNTIHPENLAAVKAAMDQGIAFAMASGRGPISCSQLALDHGLDGAYIIAANGCQMWDAPFGNEVLLETMDRAAATEVMRIIIQAGLDGCLCTDRAIVYASERMKAYYDQHGSEGAYGAEEALRSGKEGKVLAGTQALEEALNASPLKVFCSLDGGNEEAFLQAKAACAQVPGVYVASSWANNFEVMPQGVTKATALAKLAQRLGIWQEEVMAFGDQENDIPMLQWAGAGYAIAGAADNVKKAATAGCTGSCAGGGVAQAIYQHIK